MAISLYDISIPSYLQTLHAASGYLEKAAAHFKEKGVDLEEIVSTRLSPDMLPFRFQIQSIVHHSVGAIEGIKHGSFRPPSDLPDHNFLALQELVVEANQTLQQVMPDHVNGHEEAEVAFEIRDTRLLFTALGFLTSFSLPNFYFHAATAYDILRSKGVPVGKRDYLGKLRLRKS
ncbi:MAG: DUF1993 domain-containing protein [Burkholderiales bacterium]